MKCAVKTLDRALRQDFGFKHILFVYSGRRGVHCWVCDVSARQLSNEQRSSVADYLNLVTAGQNKVKADFKSTTDELHPSIEGAYSVCEKYFKEGPNCILMEQDILQEKTAPHLENILEFLSPQEKEEMRKFMTSNPAATSLDKWRQIENIVNERPAGRSFKERLDTKQFLKSIVIQFTYPRLDINVSKQMNHLLKSPFVVHPKTGRVCVPIDPSTVDEFNPLTVPTIGRLVDELNASGDAGQTSLKPYTTFFETKFLQPLETACLEQLKVGARDW
jgi:DNA primase small subunit